MASITEINSSSTDSVSPFADCVNKLKADLLSLGCLDGKQLEQALLLLGVPPHKCPPPENIVARLGLSFHNLTDQMGTIERKKNFFSSAKRKVYKTKMFKSKKDKNNETDKQESRDYIIFQLLQFSLHYLATEINTSRHNSASSYSKQTPSISTGGIYKTLSAEGLENPNLPEWSTSDTRNKVPKTSSIDEGSSVSESNEQLRKEMLELRTTKEELESKYIELKKRYTLLESKDPVTTLDPAYSEKDHFQGTPLYRSPKEDYKSNEILINLRQENESIQNKFRHAEDYIKHLEAKFDTLYKKFGNLQIRLTRTLHVNHDMSIQLARTGSISNLAVTGTPNINSSIHMPERVSHHPSTGSPHFNTTPLRRREDERPTQETTVIRDNNSQNLQKMPAPLQSKVANTHGGNSDRVLEFVQDSQQRHKQQQYELSRAHREDNSHSQSNSKQKYFASDDRGVVKNPKSQKSDYKSESSEGNLISLPGMYKYESRASNQMVLGTEIDPSVFPLSMTPEVKKQLIQALSQCNSVHELIQTVFMFGYAPVYESHDRLYGEHQCLTSQVEHLKAENQYLTLTLRECKEISDEYYTISNQYECNNELLRKAIRYADQTLEVYCALLCLYDNEHSIISISQRLSGHEPLDYGLFISSQAIADLLVGSEQSLDNTMKRLYETRQKIEQNIRHIIANYDSSIEIQRYLPLPLTQSLSHGSGTKPVSKYKRRSVGSSSPGTLRCEQTRDSSMTSGHGSMLSLNSQNNDILESDLAPEDIRRMRQYIEIFCKLKKKVCMQMVLVPGALFEQKVNFDFKVKHPESKKDCSASEKWIDLEASILLQDLSAIKEEKAKLQSQAYLLEQEKRIIEHRLCASKDQETACKLHNERLQHELRDQSRKMKKLQKELKTYKESSHSMPSTNDPPSTMHTNEIEITEAYERENWLKQKYYELMDTLDQYINRTQDRHDQLLSFVRDLKKANVALVTAYEKAKRKNQNLHKKLLTMPQRELELVAESNTKEVDTQAQQASATLKQSLTQL